MRYLGSGNRRKAQERCARTFGAFHRLSSSICLNGSTARKSSRRRIDIELSLQIQGWNQVAQMAPAHAQARNWGIGCWCVWFFWSLIIVGRVRPLWLVHGSNNSVVKNAQISMAYILFSYKLTHYGAHMRRHGSLLRNNRCEQNMWGR